MTVNEQIEKRIGYQFQQPELLAVALSHRSISGSNNERLEFLGDSILNMVIAEALYARWPHAQEGDLSRLRASLVKGETLAEVAREFELGEGLRLGSGELKSGGQRRLSILADALEAVIAAIYLDSSFETCRQCILNWYANRLETRPQDNVLRDPKTRLQEYLQGRKIALPIYTVIDTSGDPHDQTFQVQCFVEALKVTSEGIGSSRRRAEQAAAEQCLVQIRDKTK